MALTKIPAGLLDKSAHVDFADSEEIRLGTGNDLRIFHAGTENFIRGNATESPLYIDVCQNLHIRHLDTDGGNAETMIKGIGDGAVELYHNNGKKFETSSTGATVTGNLAVTGDLDITGNVNSASVTDLDVTDKTITVGAGQTEAQSGGSGLIVDGSSASFLWNETDNRFDYNRNLHIGTAAGQGTSSSPALQIGGGATYRLGLYTDSEGGIIQNLNGDDGLQFRVKTAGEAMRVDGGTGNVGIGTASPAVALDIAGSSTTQMRIQMSGQADTRVLSDTGTGIIGTYSNHPLTIKTNGSTAATIDTSGNVGIGQTGPTSHINTGTFFKPDSNGRFLTLNGGANGSFIMLESQTTTDNDQIGGIYWNRTGAQGDAHKQVAGIDVIQDTYAPNNILEGGTLRFFTKTSGTGTNTPRMVIAGGGNVGIGTTSPTQAFEVRPNDDYQAVIGRARIGDLGYDDFAGFGHYDTGSQYALLQYHTGQTFVNASSGQPINFRINNSTKMVVASSGYVGIGTSSPNAPLEVSGGVAMSGGWGRSMVLRHNFPTLVFQSEYSTDAYAAVAYDNTTGMHFMVNSPNIDVFSSSQTSAMTILDNKNIGIGDANPQHPFKVHLTSGEIAMFGSNGMNSPGNYAGIGLGQVLANGTSHQKVSLVTEGRNSGHYVQDFHILVDTAGDSGSAVLSDSKFKIDGGYGTISMPLQPSFMCYPAATYSQAGGSSKVYWTGEAHDVNNWYNNANHRFTAPVAGNYLFMGELSLEATTQSQTYLGIGIRINGSGNIFYGGWAAKTGSNNQYEKATSTIIKQLAAGDYVEIYVELSSTTTVLGGAAGALSRMSGQLLS